ncbi:hypothetical protein [Brevibacillus sp. 179-C9.3 HS]|uniref:hypothetical protein n=1 Tax=unclassified Brevibacillus TaxID=2684853 RepID=UPI0039A053DB
MLAVRIQKISLVVLSVILLSAILHLFGSSVELAKGKESEAYTNKSVLAAAKVVPKGFYAKWEMDVGGMRGCSSLCWEYFYFINDKQVATTFPDGGLDALNCSKDTCLTYQIKGNKLTLSNGKSYTFKVKSANELEINGGKFIKYTPSTGLKLHGKYESFSYSSNVLGTGYASSITYVFNKNGTFVDSSLVGVTTDGSSTGDNSGTSTSVGSQANASGTYQIVNYTISLTYKDGKTKKLLFFLPEQPSAKMLRIGGRDFLLADGTAAKPQPPEPPYADFLTTKKIAKKQVLFTFKPNKSDQYDNIKITLQGYQWAKLAIEPAYVKSFQGFGDKGIVALTAKYRIDNASAQTVKVSSMQVTLDLPDSKASVKAANGLTPTVKDELKQGESVESMLVILVPAEHFEKNKDFKLWFGPLLNLKGQDVLQEEWLNFNIWKKL